MRITIIYLEIIVYETQVSLVMYCNYFRLENLNVYRSIIAAALGDEFPTHASRFLVLRLYKICLM